MNFLGVSAVNLIAIQDVLAEDVLCVVGILPSLATEAGKSALWATDICSLRISWKERNISYDQKHNHMKAYRNHIMAHKTIGNHERPYKI